jgi:hypothetical protein
VDAIAARIQSLGAISLAMAADVAETTIIPRPPRGREEVPVQISGLLEAHEILLKEAHTMPGKPTKPGMMGQNFLWWTCRSFAPIRQRPPHPTAESLARVSVTCLRRSTLVPSTSIRDGARGRSVTAQGLVEG